VVNSDDLSSEAMSVSQTSSALIRQAQHNDADAWRVLVELYSRRVYRWCRRRGLQPADAANVVQEVLRSVARKLADFDHDHAGASFRGWLRRITDNKVRDFYRGLSREVNAAGGSDAYRRLMNLAASQEASSSDDEPTWVTCEPHADAAPALPAGGSLVAPRASNLTGSPFGGSSEQIAAVRAEFSERDWRVFWHVVVDGQTAAEAGSEFGMTANAVRLVKMKLLRRLRAKLTSGE
jgi:RNA polymerase sigma-70 factor (ECF subfamily)